MNLLLFQLKFYFKPLKFKFFKKLFIYCIYDLVKIEQGLLEANNSTFYLLKIIDKLKRKYTKIAVKKQLEFDIILDHNLPHYLNGDTQKLLQILDRKTIVFDMD
jgi:hypothetical protein